MTAKMFEFMLAYADVYDMLDIPFESLREWIDYMLEEAHDGDEQDNFFNESEYINEFMEHYKDMKENFLDDEVKDLMSEGMSFFTACEDWDI